jgi:glycosyltransferase involved in cell wall biosynthesis
MRELIEARMPEPTDTPVPAAPLVSIVLPTFNRLRYLPDAVASVFAQTFQDWELLIADDGSEAQTRAYLRTLHDPPRVRLIELTHTGKPATVRNAALREARGRFVAFMDSDDVWMPRKLSIQMAALRADGDCAWSHTKFLLVDVHGGSPREMPAANGWILGSLLRTETVIALPSVVASRALLSRLGNFDEELTMCEDYDLWLRLAAHSRVAAIAEPLTVVRRHAEHYGNAAISFRDSIRVLNKVLHTDTAAPYLYFVRRERAQSTASLARCHIASGDRIAALRMLLSSVRYSWRHRGWWSEAFKATVTAFAPRLLRSTIRKHIHRGRQP